MSLNFLGFGGSVGEMALFKELGLKSVITQKKLFLLVFRKQSSCVRGQGGPGR